MTPNNIPIVRFPQKGLDLTTSEKKVVKKLIKAAEAIVDLKDRLGWPAISRAGIYAMPREKDIKRVRSMFGLKPF